MSLAMLSWWLYLGSVMIAPQLWYEPLLNWRVDLIILPIWMLGLLAQGRLGSFFTLRTQDRCFLVFVIWIFLSAAINGTTHTLELMIPSYVKWFIVYRLLVLTVSNPVELRQAAAAFLFYAVMLSVESIQHEASADGLGWAGQPFGWVDPAAATIGLDKRTKWVGIFDGPGVFAVIFTVALPFCLRYISRTYSLSTRLVNALVIAPMLLVSLYFTGSRGGMLTGAAIFGMYVLARIKLSLPKLIGVTIVGFSLVMLAPSYLTDTKDSSGSAQHRISMWAEGIEMLQQNPVFGIGRMQFGSYTGSLIAHNSAVEIMGELGIPGIFCWLGIIYLGLRNLYLRGRETSDAKEKALLLALAISVLGYCVSAMFVTLEYETFYCLLALTAGVAAWTESAKRVEWVDLRRIGAIIFSFLLALKLYVMSYV